MSNLTPIVVGLTGGIGSGKSTVCALFETYGTPIIDTDTIAREVVEVGSEGLKGIIQLFGNRFLKADNTLDRSKLRTFIFQNPDAKKQLEALLHPLIQVETQRKIKHIIQSNQPNTKFPLIIIAIPLLTESIIKQGSKPDYIDQVWVIDTPVELQIQRASLRDNRSTEDIKRIIQQQASRIQRLNIADRVITNTQNRADLHQQVQSIMDTYSK